MPPLLPDEDKNFGGSLVLDFGKWWRHVKTIYRELKHARFWDADGNRKWAVFTFNLPSHNHIHIAKYLFSIRDE